MAFLNGAFWIEVAKAAPTAIVAALIGGLTVRVAHQQRSIAAEQKRIAAAKLNLDLFDRRLKVFEATREFLRNSIPGGPNGLFATIPSLSEASFLFGDEVVDFMILAVNNNVELRTLEGRVAANGGIPPPDVLPRLPELENWFLNNANGGCIKVFMPYLGFSRWQSAD